MDKAILSVVAYIIVGVIVFAISYEANEDMRPTYNREPAAVMSGALWPFYLGGTAALALVRSFKSKECVAVTDTKTRDTVITGKGWDR